VTEQGVNRLSGHVVLGLSPIRDDSGGLLAVQASHAQNAVSQPRTPPAEAVATPVINRLDAAWNAADGAAFAREFAADADVINSIAAHISTRISKIRRLCSRSTRSTVSAATC
jgi:hypothetical protein